jgi:membrane-bound lytic murein transglycosylase MltF
MRTRQLLGSVTALALLLAVACSPTPAGDSASPAGEVPPLAGRSADEPLPPPVSPYDALPAESRSVLDLPFTGDLSEMVKRRMIRAGVVYNRTLYFIDEGQQRGMVYESLKNFEDELNKRLNTGLLRVHVAFVPLSRDQLFPALAEGKVDLVAAGLTVTPEREALVAFSTPTRTDVSELVVTNAKAAPVATVSDLSGREVFVRRSSSYYGSLVDLNAALKAQGRPPVTIKEAPEALETEDLIEMVNAGLVEATVADEHIADFWAQVFPDVRVNREAAIRTGGTIAVAVRKENPELLQAADTWIEQFGRGTAFGNIIERRYFQNTVYVKRASDEAERKKFQALVELFRKYGEQYNLDYLLMAAQGYQESTLDHAARSPVGAIGIMQIMPATGRDLNVGDITELENNIHGGVKYIRFMMDQYYKDEPMDEINKVLMTLASYNAGPGRIRQLRRETASRGLDPNRWFGNVERVVAERIGRETVQYVGNIYKYYVAYTLTNEQVQERRRLMQP